LNSGQFSSSFPYFFVFCALYVIDTGIRTSHSEFGGLASADYDTVNDDGVWGNEAYDNNG
jgi:hypothetical protein